MNAWLILLRLSPNTHTHTQQTNQKKIISSFFLLLLLFIFFRMSVFDSFNSRNKTTIIFAIIHVIFTMNTIRIEFTLHNKSHTITFEFVYHLRWNNFIYVTFFLFPCSFVKECACVYLCLCLCVCASIC